MDSRGLVHSVGMTISARRKARGLTQAQLAEAMGIEKETVSRIETGVISATLTRLAQIAGILECPVSALFLRPPSAEQEDASVCAVQVEQLVLMLESLSARERALVVHLVEEVVHLLQQRP